MEEVILDFANWTVREHDQFVNFVARAKFAPALEIAQKAVVSWEGFSTAELLSEDFVSNLKPSKGMGLIRLVQRQATDMAQNPSKVKGLVVDFDAWNMKQYQTWLDALNKNDLDGACEYMVMVVQDAPPGFLTEEGFIDPDVISAESFFILTGAIQAEAMESFGEGN